MTKKTAAFIALALALGCGRPASAQDAAADIYKTYCAICHGVNGDADTPAGKNLKAKAFSAPDSLTKSDGELLQIARRGKGQMPPWSDVLTDAQLKSVIEYIRTFQKK